MSPSPHSPPGARGRRTNAVYKALLEDIRQGHFPINSQLPPENELARTHAVSRPVIRSALALLRQEGLVRTVRGSGSIVLHNPLAPRDDREGAGTLHSSVHELQRCFEFRILIEGEAAYAAALRHNPQSMQAMSDSIYQRSDILPSRREPAQAYHTFDFHHAVVAAADSTFLQRSFDMAVESAGFRIYLSRTGRGSDEVSKLTQVNAEHIEILKLIERRHAIEARDAMRAHIQRAYDLFVERVPLVKL